VQENKLAGWGYSAGGLLVAAAINSCPDLFRAAILKVYMNIHVSLITKTCIIIYKAVIVIK
jgi:protease II